MDKFQKKWLWMMDYCESKSIPPAQSWAWDEAENEYNANTTIKPFSEIENMTRVLLYFNNKKSFTFGFVKDGMIKEQGSNNWTMFDDYDGWLGISDLRDILSNHDKT